MKSKLNNWAAALRVFWGITAALALFSGIIIAYVSENYLWIVYCAVGAASVFITMFALASLLNGVAMLVPDIAVYEAPSAPDKLEEPPAPQEEDKPTPVDPKHPDY